MGMCRFLQGRTDEARRLMEAAVVHLPKDPALLVALANLDLQEGRAAEAERRLRAVLEADPSDTEALFVLASALQFQGRTEEAAAVLADYERKRAIVDRINDLLKDKADSPTATADDYAEIGHLFFEIGRDKFGVYWSGAGAGEGRGEPDRPPCTGRSLRAEGRRGGGRSAPPTDPDGDADRSEARSGIPRRGKMTTLINQRRGSLMRRSIVAAAAVSVVGLAAGIGLLPGVRGRRQRRRRPGEPAETGPVGPDLFQDVTAGVGDRLHLPQRRGSSAAAPVDPGVARRRRGRDRLRRRRAARPLPARRRPLRRAGQEADPRPPVQALPQPRRLEVQGRDRRGRAGETRRRQAVVLQPRRRRRRLRPRRLARPARHRLGADRPVPQRAGRQGRSAIRGRHRDGRAGQGITWATSAAFADLDGDGLPDLYVCQYVDWSFANHPDCNYDGKTPDVCPPKKFNGLPTRSTATPGPGRSPTSAPTAGLILKGASRRARRSAWSSST